MKKFILTVFSALLFSAGLMQAAVVDDLQIINDVNYEVYIPRVIEERSMQKRSFPADAVWNYMPQQLESFGFRTVVIDTDSGTINVKYPFPRPEGAAMAVKLSEIENTARTLYRAGEISREPAMIGDIEVYLSR